MAVVSVAALLIARFKSQSTAPDIILRPLPTTGITNYYQNGYSKRLALLFIQPDNNEYHLTPCVSSAHPTCQTFKSPAAFPVSWDRK